MNKEISKTWLLFESGDGVEVKLSLHWPPAKTTRPIDAYMTIDCGVGFDEAAQRAAQSVYDTRPSYFEGRGPLALAFDIGLPSGRNVTGESGGLAFAVALAKKISGIDPGPVAATGEITAGGSVSRIEGIEAKLRAADRLVPENSWILYPEENDEEIPYRLRTALKDKGIRLRPVSSVAEAIEILFEPGKGEKEPEKRKAVARWPFLLGVLLLAVFGITFGITSSIDRGKRPLEEKGVKVVNEEPAEETIVKQTEPQKPAVKKKEADSSPISSQTNKRAALVGEGALASRLAQLLNRSFRKPSALPEKGRLSGRIIILSINENRVNDRVDIQSVLKVAAKGLVYKNQRNTSTLPDFQIEVKGDGKASSLIERASNTLSSAISTAISNRQENRPKLDKGAGFE